MTNSPNRQKAVDMIRQGVILVIRGCVLLECGFSFTDFLPKDVRGSLIEIDSRTSVGGTGVGQLTRAPD